ncbi:hypothetical protein Pla86_15680 [Planctomycetes bacterium Pla86]|uniref:Uncharacterized protein n=1 Tax=Engelhardtia mirabilis TaxID=2528011 RepID=A0A518BHQ8_9BACT|nr:hypothetical protein Pla133_15690 [Planctomycetes bacterium Pla133]QDV00821.1 hypothetical protein Pla86_15680 [Planctomycetes bacterium Pla86]
MIPSTWFQEIRKRRLTAAIGASSSQPMAYASKAEVNREPGSPQGTATCLTPCSEQRMRGTWAMITVRYSQVSR